MLFYISYMNSAICYGAIVRLYIVKILVLLDRKSRNIIIEINQFLLKSHCLNNW
jgi:hypothetical protein